MNLNGAPVQIASGGAMYTSTSSAESSAFKSCVDAAFDELDKLKA